MGLIFYFIAYWVASHVFCEYLSPARWRRRRRLAHAASHLRERLRWDRDILPAPRLAVLEKLAAEADELRRGPDDPARVQAFFERAQAELHRLAVGGFPGQVKETLETLVVVFGVVMGIRGLFVLPFKIPTGSMQPTLFGYHFEPSDRPPASGPLDRVLGYVNFAAEPVAVQAKGDGALANATLSQQALLPLGSLRFFPYVEMACDGQTYRFPGEVANVQKYLLSEYERQHRSLEPGLPFRAGDVLAQGHLVEGDYLFVDCLSYSFREPRRGEIVVFNTEGIAYNGRPLNGRYYVKRLVGLPGEELKIENRRLYVRPPGGEWQMLDEQVSPAFPRLYSMRGGYHGYYLPGAGDGAWVLNEATPVVKLGPDQYWMCGDNSENSLDSRYWGPVPRANLVGRAVCVWWPFSRRWGAADRAEPLDFASPPVRGRQPE